MCLRQLLVFCLVFSEAGAQVRPGVRDDAAQTTTTITVQTSLVLVPALVKSKSGELVFSLTADDFVLTDDGVPQTLRLEADTDRQPLALVETGGAGAKHLVDYREVDSMLDALIGNVPHRVAVVGFDSEPQLLRGFTSNTDAVVSTLNRLEEGNDGAAALDGLGYAVDLLRKQPTTYRRAILMLSETVDSGSQTSFEDALRAVSDTNTAIYSFGFSSSKAQVAHEARKFGYRGMQELPPGPAKGCFSREGADAEDDEHYKRQVLDCLSQVLPPLRLATMASILTTNGMRRNVPESVARLTGGEYFLFKNAKTLAGELVHIMNDVPNRYVLSFRPSGPSGGPHAGLHTLSLRLKAHPELVLEARSSYWVDGK